MLGHMTQLRKWQKGPIVLAIGMASCKTGLVADNSNPSADPSGSEVKLELSEVFSNKMILQRDKNIVIWGKAPSGSEVCVNIFSLGNTDPIRSGCHRAESNHRFRIELPPLKGSITPHTMIAENLGTKKVIEDVLVGDVWLASGQSNMQLMVKYALEKDEAFQNLNRPNIRVFVQEMITSDMRDNTSPVPLFHSTGASWRRAISPKEIEDSSAIGFFFARKLSDLLSSAEENIPIGILNTAVGASDVYAWISPKTMLSHDTLREKMPNKWLTKGGPRYQESYLQPTACFNHKLAPLAPFAIRGFLWTQGALIDDWREHWQDPDLPFIFTQAHPTAFPYDEPSKLDELAFTREAQIDTIADVSSTCILPIHDVVLSWNFGDFQHKHPIHPLSKKTVGERMAEAAWQLSYKGRKDCHAPVFSHIEIDGSRAKVYFKYVGDGLVYRKEEKKIRGFAISGTDRQFVPAYAKITGKNSVEVWHPQIDRPVAVTYAFTQMNQGSNLLRQDGVPVSPFRSDRTKSTYLRIKPTLRQEAEMVNLLHIDPPGMDQLMSDPQASRQAYRLFKSPTTKGSMTYEMITVDEGTYSLTIQAVKGPQFGQARITLDGNILAPNIDFYDQTQRIFSTSLATKIQLKPGSHSLQVELVGKNSAATDQNLGIDMFELIQHGPQHHSVVDDW
jgi:sialate O-acetylesterase